MSCGRIDPLPIRRRLKAARIGVTAVPFAFCQSLVSLVSQLARASIRVLPTGVFVVTFILSPAPLARQVEARIFRISCVPLCPLTNTFERKPSGLFLTWNSGIPRPNPWKAVRHTAFAHPRITARKWSSLGISTSALGCIATTRVFRGTATKCRYTLRRGFAA